MKSARAEALALDDPRDLWRTFAAVVAPAPDLWLPEWADQYRMLAGKAAAEPGPYSVARTPYVRAIMERLSPQSPTELVVLRKASRVGFTEVANCWLGMVMHRGLGSVLAITGTDDMRDRWVLQQIDPMVEATPVLRDLVLSVHVRGKGSTRFIKNYPGGSLTIASSGSPAAYRQTTAPFVVLDEVSLFKARAKEGAHLELAERAQRTFIKKKTLAGSSPGLEGACAISELLEDCEACFSYYVPCPHCGYGQVLVRERLRYTVPAGFQLEGAKGRPRRIPGTVYECASATCGRAIEEHHKTAMLADGWWLPDWHQGELSVGFDRLSSLYAPVGWFSWGEIAAMQERARERPERMQVLVNTVDGLPYREPTEAPAWEPLYARREEYAVGIVPPGVRFLTAGVDVQHGWLAVEIVGWGRGNRSWSITYRLLVGDTTDPARGAWADLTALLATDWPCAGGGTLPITCLAIDSGDNAPTVYKWAKQHARPAIGGGRVRVTRLRTVMVCKGWAGWGPAIRTAAKANATEKQRGGLKLAHLSTWTLKRELYKWVSRDAPDPGGPEPYGWCHWPVSEEHYGARYFTELTSNVYRQKNHKWTFDLPPGCRDEALDCRLLARAGAMAYGVEDFTERDWQRIEARLAATCPGLVGRSAPQVPPPPPPAPSATPAASGAPAVLSPPPRPAGSLAVGRGLVMSRSRYIRR